MPTDSDIPNSTPDLSPPAGQVLPPAEVRGSQGVQTGSHNTQNNTFVKCSLQAMESTSALPGLSRIPAEIPLFVGRSGELEQLERILDEAGRAAVVAVHGLGGVGKSTLAAQFVRLNADKFEFCWWITADSPTGIEMGLADLAVAIVPETAEFPVEQRRDLGIRWLATHDGWLLVLDNVTSSNHVSSLLERVRTGSVLMTSRTAAGWGQLASVRLDVLTSDETLELLTRTIRADWPEVTPDALGDAERLCKELGYLPLAIEQAGAYIAHTRITHTRYLELLAQYPARMFTATAEGGDAQRTMARVWHVTLDLLTDTPLTGQLLRQLAWYAPDNIPRALVESSGNGAEAAEALGRLAAYNMITLTSDNISVHRLVQAVTRTPDPEDLHRHPRDVARARDVTVAALAGALNGTNSELPAVWPRYRALVPHALALLCNIDPNLDSTHLCVLASYVGGFLIEQGSIATALTMLERATRSHERLHGPDHPDSLNLRNSLALAHQATGDLNQAIPLFEAIYIDSERILGEDHFETFRARHNLGHAYNEAGDLRRAASIQEPALERAERVLGPDDPITLGLRGALAVTYLDAEDLERAIPLLEAALADSERLVGTSHPHTLRARDNLANAYQKVGKLQRAISLHEAVVADFARTMGRDHPGTLIARDNLASAYMANGDAKRAIPLREEVVADYKRTLGNVHPEALTAQNNLAKDYLFSGARDRAISLLEAIVADNRRERGDYHPTSLGAQNTLASAYLASGDYGLAILLFRGVLLAREHLLSVDHPQIISSRNNLAGAYVVAGQPELALPLFTAALSDAERAYGVNHPVVRYLRSNVDVVSRQLEEVVAPEAEQ